LLTFIIPALLQTIFGVSVLSYFDPTIGLLALSVFPVYIYILWQKIRKSLL